MEPITITDAAYERLSTIFKEEGDPNLMVRVSVQGGGCSGFMYGFDFADCQNEDDFVIERDGVKVVVDSMSYQYLVGASLDFVDGLEFSQFVVNNPNANTTCGCGSSFSV